MKKLRLCGAVLLVTAIGAIPQEKLPTKLSAAPQPGEMKFDCNNPQGTTLSSFLAGLNPDKTATVRVSGTCTDNLHHQRV